MPTNLDDFIIEYLNRVNLTESSAKKPLEANLTEQTKEISERKSTNASNKTEHVIILEERIEPVNKR